MTGVSESQLAQFCDIGLWFVVMVMKFVQMLPGGSRLLKAIAHKELASVLNDDALSLHSEMLIVKVMQFSLWILPNPIMAKMPAALLPACFVLTALLCASTPVITHNEFVPPVHNADEVKLFRGCWPLTPLSCAGERELLLAAQRNLAAECC